MSRTKVAAPGTVVWMVGCILLHHTVAWYRFAHVMVVRLREWVQGFLEMGHDTQSWALEGFLFLVGGSVIASV